ncbi:LacI family DNA-binding transcriptional regulator [Pseudomonas typographi]|uniref:LacI family transcriptional regulator n=1 Tax=Pseudomonas typographi TaxID=2715964 RepID=A0ABR7Z7E2_9PSED|nr:LacI family DNA-binding transcriptional regulator [Pseudomonas typographi]MBD1601221.1 LacI family transcriptional regulator [Pseudomonas typographi]
MATLKDVAALAGISYTTVSHVLNNTRPVSEPVRRKVEAAIEQLAYVPSGVARSLKARATATIGLLLPNSINPYFAELARGIGDHCGRNGYCVILCNADDDAAKQRHYLRMLLEKRIDGLLLASAGPSQGTFDALPIPLVVLDREAPALASDVVCIDHEQGAWLATQHLLGLGHRRIACITGPANVNVANLRAAGYRRAMADYGCAVVPGWQVNSDFTSDGGYRAAGHLFGSVQPSAIFAANDMLGVGVLRAAAERGIRVPQQLSVIGFDDIELCRYVYPALSSVGQSIRQLGERAAAQLLGRISGEQAGPPQRLVVAPALIARESTAALAQP